MAVCTHEHGGVQWIMSVIPVMGAMAQFLYCPSTRKVCRFDLLLNHRDGESLVLLAMAQEEMVVREPMTENEQDQRRSLPLCFLGLFLDFLEETRNYLGILNDGDGRYLSFVE